MKKSFLLLFFFLLLIYNGKAFADKLCETKKWYELYQCRNKNICEQYKPETLLYSTLSNWDYEELLVTDSYVKKSKSLKTAKEKYVDNMNNIYVCATIKIRINALEEITKTLLKINMAKEVEKIVWEKFNTMKIDAKSDFNTKKCKWINKKWTYSKITVLKQWTWEMCKYRNYLEYLRNINKDIRNLNLDKPEVSIENLIEIKNLNDRAINKEIEHIYKVFPVAFNTYSLYENNFIIHLYLQLIKADFWVLRRKLHEALWPINQVGYKIVNAMSL